MNVRTIKKKIAPVLKKYNITKAGIFGSAARGEMNKDSDIDILIDLDKSMSLLDFVGIKQELEEALHKKVDLVEYSTIKPFLREKIFKEEVAI